MPKSNANTTDGFAASNGFMRMMQPDVGMYSRMLAPMLAANVTMLNWTARNCEMMAQASQHWFQFLGQRFNEDASFAEKMQKAKDPEQIATACSKFVEKAAKDYQVELSELTKISGKFSNEMSDAIQDLSQDLSKPTGAVMGE